MFNLSNYKNVEINSNFCVKDSIFICFKNNEKYIKNAILNGATLIIHSHVIKVKQDIKYMKVKNINETLEKILEYFYPYNSKLIGITGTDGKTTTSLIIFSLINQVSTCGYIGTNGIKYNNSNISTINTTPDLITLRKTIFEMSNNNINYITIECSSEGILSNRLLGLRFDSLIYTNLSHEHLNTHKNMKNYYKTKLKLIKQLLPNGLICVNKDDHFFKKIKHNNIKYYGLSNCYCTAKNITSSINKTNFTCSLNQNKVITTPLFGLYNVYNTLASILILERYNLFDKVDFLNINKIDGRFELINSNIVIDFAHTPNALESLLKNIKDTTRKKIILIFGAAGNKDKSKRPKLGEIANKYADQIIVTSEDPKDEPLTNIFYSIIKKIKKEYYLVLFRKDAVKLGLSLLDANHILVIVGKGLENYENILNYKIEYNDYNYIKSLLNS